MGLSERTFRDKKSDVSSWLKSSILKKIKKIKNKSSNCRNRTEALFYITKTHTQTLGGTYFEKQQPLFAKEQMPPILINKRSKRQNPASEKPPITKNPKTL